MKRLLRVVLLPVAVLSLAACFIGPTWAQEKPARPEIGRFQIVAAPATSEVLGKVYLLDTATGKAWREACFQDAEGDDNGLAGQPCVWIPVTRLNSKEEVYAFGARHPKKATEQKTPEAP